MENIKKAANILNKDYDIEDIFSIESKVIQNTEIVTDIQAVCFYAANTIRDYKKLTRLSKQIK
jgi:hypothetical protein